MADPIDELLARYQLPAAARADLERLARRAQSTVVADDEDPPADDLVAAEGFEDRGALGAGGMAEVRRVHDPRLARTVAMKIARPELSAAGVGRFVREAQLTGRLAHPGILPVYQLGHLPDGRPWFTMREIDGTTLGARIRAVHAASPPGAWGAADGWTWSRLVDAVRRVCDALAHAHRAGVVHRDLKPDNVMVGVDGEVLVVDWGLARRLDDPSRPEIAGTPAYLAPEQARGEALSPRTDVFALGGLLLEVLTGRPPRGGGTTEALLRSAAVEPVSWTATRPVPGELLELVADCLAPDPAHRPADASVVAARMDAWRDGVGRRERAVAWVEQARTTLAGAEAARARLAAVEAQLEAAAGQLQPWDPVEVRRPVWALEDEVRGLRQQVGLDVLAATEQLRAALGQDAECLEARRALAAVYRAEHARALERGDADAARVAEAQLRAHDDGVWAAWLAGEGALRVETAPGAPVAIDRWVERDRRLVPEPVATVDGPATLRLPPGSYRLRSAGVAALVVLPRCGEAAVAADAFTPRGPLGPDDVFVPGGPFVSGGDPLVTRPTPRRVVTVPAFVVRRFPVTNAEWIAWLDALVADGREEEALAHVPRDPGLHDGAPLYGRDPDGRFVLVPDAHGDRWAPDWPVLFVSAADAEAYAAWCAARTGLAWRLGTADEWEKAARGLDGRRFPWGDHPVAVWSVNRMARPGRPLPAPVGAFDTDESPYGVRHLAGNAATWTSTTDAAGMRTVCGGAWSYGVDMGRGAFRTGARPDRRSAQVGVRLFRDG